MPLYERHVFVCTNTRADGQGRPCCAGQGGAALRNALKASAARKGFKGLVRINAACCLDQCEHGPVVVVYPEQVWYGFVKPEDAEEIVESHLVHGQPVERLIMDDACINTPECAHRQRGARKKELPPLDPWPPPRPLSVDKKS